MQNKTAADAQDILDFWFGEIGSEGWWKRSADTDAAIRARFLGIWEQWRDRPAASFADNATDALATVVLFDQFSRNMFRGNARAFATDPRAREIAARAIDRSLDRQLTRDQRIFLYMPFMHSEDAADQDKAVALFETLGQPDQVKYAQMHRDIIVRFGRFPARNAVLGRADRPGEAEAIAATANW
jgi:uncharacterized protein (DUF924 family)